MTCIVVLLYRRLAPVVMRVASAHRLIFATVGVRALLPPRPSAVGAFVVDALVSAVTTLVTVTLLSLPPRSSSSPRLVSQRCCVSAPGARVVLQPPFLCVGTSVAVQYSPTQPGPHASRVLNLLLQNQNCFPSRASVAPRAARDEPLRAARSRRWRHCLPRRRRRARSPVIRRAAQHHNVEPPRPGRPRRGSADPAARMLHTIDVGRRRPVSSSRRRLPGCPRLQLAGCPQELLRCDAAAWPWVATGAIVASPSDLCLGAHWPLLSRLAPT